jgi:hypothetical protein
MGVLTPKRAVLCVVATLVATSVFATNPSPRTGARMTWDREENVGVLFGGRGPFDGATGLPHDNDETWLFNGTRWLQRFPAVKPPGRSDHTMTFDSKRNRVVMFGGRRETVDIDSVATFLGDTWFYKDETWTAATPATSPEARQFADMAYDPTLDRIILYGGSRLNATATALDSFFDTWEFDGAQWTRVAIDSPKVAKPILAYDATAKEVIMLGLNDTATAIVMYRYRGATHAWEAVTPEKFPTCVNDGHLVYQEHTRRLLFYGGTCATATPGLDEVFEWTGTNWTKLTTSGVTRGVGQAATYDPLRRSIVSFGGTVAGGATVTSVTNLFQVPTLKWVGAVNLNRPSPRSLATFQLDPTTNTVWMYGGLDETSTFFGVDLWGYRGGQWFFVPFTTGPGSECNNPLSAYDTNRSRLVLLCGGTDTFEWDGAAWKSFADLSKEPQVRRFAGMVYDPNLKKTVLFGGFNNNNYRNDTWTWDGTAWTEVKVDGKQRPPNRGLMAMWYDPLQKKVILYGGLGRGNLNERISRYDDMWAFNGTGWQKLPVTQTPGARFGPQFAVNANTGKLLLFGGLRSEPIDEDSLRQFFVNDTWEWDGTASTWTRIQTDPNTAEPDVRENGSMAWDPVTGELVLFGGYAEGFYRSDVWSWNGTDWVPHREHGQRRRAVR